MHRMVRKSKYLLAAAWGIATKAWAASLVQCDDAAALHQRTTAAPGSHIEAARPQLAVTGTDRTLLFMNAGDIDLEATAQ